MELIFDKRNRAKIGNFTILKKTENVFHINDGTPSFVTLIKGNKLALLVDTSWGVQNLRGLVESLISTPYIVVNTHGHPDHCFGNFQFEEVLIPEKDIKVYERIKDYESDRNKFVSSNDEKNTINIGSFPPLKTVKAGDFFDLGGITVEAIPLYGHTSGSLGYLINEEKILLSGDAINSNVWLFMEESLSLEDCIKTYKKTLKLPFEKILSSHGKVFWSKDLVNSIILNLKQVMQIDYKFTDENYEKIMGYHTSRAFSSFGKDSGWILVPDRRFV